MSLAELTRNAFQGGLSAEKWLGLSRLLMSKSPEQTTSNLSNSVLILFRTYPGSPILHSYLHSALHGFLLPLPTFISTFLQAARSPELHVPSTLYTLLRTALEAHYTFGSTGGADASVVPKGEPVSGILRVVGDALALLRTVCGLVRTNGGGVRTLSSTQDLLSAASELLVLLLASVPTDLSRVQTAQAIGLYNEMNETVGAYQSLMLTYHGHGQHHGLWPDEHSGLIGVLETFMVTLSLVVGEDVRIAQAAAAAVGTLDMGFGMNMGMDAFAAPAGTGPVNIAVAVPQQSSSDMDAVTLGLLLNHMVTHTSYNFGAGDTGNAVALLLAVFRSSSWSASGSNNFSSSSTSNPSGSTTTVWTPAAFGTQILVAALECFVVKSQQGKGRLWKGFVVGRLPFLLASLVDVVSKDNSTNVDMRKGFQDAILTVFRRHDIFLQVEHALSLSSSPSGGNTGESNQTLNQNQSQSYYTDDESSSSRPFSRQLLHQLVKQKLISLELATQIDPMLLNDSPIPKWYAEAGDAASDADISAYLESKVMHDIPSEEIKFWIERIWNDPGSHPIFAGIVTKRFTSAISSMDIDILGPTCKLLHTYDCALEIVGLHTRICDLIFYSLLFLEEYDCEIVGDPQTAVSHLGDVVLFVQYALAKFKFENHEFTKDNVTVSTASFSDVDVYLRAHGRTPEDMTTFNTWTKALFDTNSEGIEDNILRATKPKILIRVALPLVSQAISAATSHHKFDKDVLMNGISYFTGPLLSWVLVGVIKYLVREVQQRQFLAPVHYEVLQTLILSPSCPRSVLVLCSTQIGILVSDRKRQVPSTAAVAASASPFNVSAVKQTVNRALGGLTDGEPYFAPASQPQIWYQQVQQAIQTAFAMARSQHKTPPHLDLRRCLNTLPPIKFLQILWAEIQAAANMGEAEVCRRIATFVLTTPIVDGKSMARHYPLLPIFLHVVLPGIIAEADRLPPQQEEQTMRVDLIVAVISSVLSAAMHLEWTLRSVSIPDHHQQQPLSGASQSPAVVPVLGQTSNGMARRLALDLRRNRKSEASKMILQRLAASHPFVANFPVFKSELGTT